MLLMLMFLMGYCYAVFRSNLLSYTFSRSRTQKEKHFKAVVINVRIIEEMHISGVLRVSRCALLWILVIQ